MSPESGGQLNLFSADQRIQTCGSSCSQHIALPDADIEFFPAFFTQDESDRLFAELMNTVTWNQEHIRWYGKTLPLPRETAWYGDEGKNHKYSGILVQPLPWIPVLLEIKAAIESASGTTFNSVLLNKYRNGRDSVSWHSDDEKELGPLPIIGSVSLGQSRQFRLRHKANKALRTSIDLTHGSFMIMKGRTQDCWDHEIPKSARVERPRINLTFRDIKESTDKRVQRGAGGTV